MIDYSLTDYIKGEYRLGERVVRNTILEPGSPEFWILAVVHGTHIATSLRASVSSCEETVIPTFYGSCHNWDHASEVLRQLSQRSCGDDYPPTEYLLWFKALGKG